MIDVVLTLILLLIPYVAVGTVYARKTIARTKYECDVLKLPGRAMDAHATRCGSRKFSGESYKRVYCNCGYYKRLSGIPNAGMLVAFWWADWYGQYLHKGTYRPKPTKAEIEVMEKMVSKEVSRVNYNLIAHLERINDIPPLKESA